MPVLTPAQSAAKKAQIDAISKIGNTHLTPAQSAAKKSQIDAIQSQGRTTLTPEQQAQKTSQMNYARNGTDYSNLPPLTIPPNSPVLGGYKKGGSVKKTGLYKVHKGEEVISKKKAMARKMSPAKQKHDYAKFKKKFGY